MKNICAYIRFHDINIHHHNSIIQSYLNKLVFDAQLNRPKMCLIYFSYHSSRSLNSFKIVKVQYQSYSFHNRFVAIVYYWLEITETK